MYKRVRLRDTVEVPPRFLADVSEQLVKELLQDKLEGRMDEDVGSVVSVVDVVDIGDGSVLPGEPGVYYDATFDAITFDPQMQEVVDGEVVEVARSSASGRSTACCTSPRSPTSTSRSTRRTSNSRPGSPTASSAPATRSAHASSRRASTSATRASRRSG